MPARRGSALSPWFLLSVVAASSVIGSVGSVSYGSECEEKSAKGKRPASPATSAEPTTAAEQEGVVAVGNELRYSCSGVLVHPQAVLTARHCLPATRIGLGPDAKQPRESIAVREVRLPPDRRPDAALLLLARPLTDLVPISFRGKQESEPPAGEVVLIGYGGGPGGSYGKRRALEASIAGWGCDLLRSRFTGCNPELELVLPRSRGFDTCDGDSGGPMLEREDCRLRLLAITSRPIAQYRLRCGDGGVYVRLDALAPWLESELARLRATADPSAASKP